MLNFSGYRVEDPFRGLSKHQGHKTAFLLPSTVTESALEGITVLLLLSLDFYLFIFILLSLFLHESQAAPSLQ